MKQRKIIALILAVLFAGSAFAMTLVVSGPVETKEVSVKPFTKLNVRTQYDVYLSQGNKEELVIETYRSIMPYVIVEERDNELIISLDRKINNIKWMGHDNVLKLHITVKDIERINLSGACDLYMQTDLKVEDFRMDASGASDLVMKTITGKNIKMNTSGASDIREADFKAETMYINASGASDANISIEANDVEIIASGASDFDLIVYSQKLKISAHGSSDFYAEGTSEYLNANLSGSSSLKAYDLKTGTTEIDASGSSDCRVNVTKSITATSSGASSIYYSGKPNEVSVDVSGVSSIKSK